MTEVFQAPFPGASHFSPSPIRTTSLTDLPSLNTAVPYSDRPNHKPSCVQAEYEYTYSTSAPSSAPSSPQLTHSTSSRRPSVTSTPGSSISNDPEEDDDDDPFPSYDNYCNVVRLHTDSQPESKLVQVDEPPENPIYKELPGHVLAALEKNRPILDRQGSDDHEAQPEPSRHVDYLSHEWKEEDIWSSWRYVVARRKDMGNSTRLENASWRTWMKAKNNLKTISPETLNWLKDCDVTWLYGPLQSDTRRKMHTELFSPPSRLSHSSSFVHKKPILKKKSHSEAILQRSLSSQTILQRAGAALASQRSSPGIRPGFDRASPDFGSSLRVAESVPNTPAERSVSTLASSRPSFARSGTQTPSEHKHVGFNETVRQVRAVEFDEVEQVEEVVDEPSEDEDDDGGLMMRSTSSRTSTRSTPSGSFSGDAKTTITELPSERLKGRDTPDFLLRAQPPNPTGSWLSGRQLSPSPSQETLRPSRPSQNFLIDDDDEDPDVMPWQSRSGPSQSSPSPYGDEHERVGMRRTESGMFMPYETEDEAAMNNSLFGQVMYAVNTVKDIGHVVWNVGWRRGP